MLHFRQTTPSSPRALRPLIWLAALLAALLWVGHPVLHAGEGLALAHAHHGHPAGDSKPTTHHGPECPLGSLRDLAGPAPTLIAAPAAPLLIEIQPAAACATQPRATPVPANGLPRPPPLRSLA